MPSGTLCVLFCWPDDASSGRRGASQTAFPRGSVGTRVHACHMREWKTAVSETSPNCARLFSSFGARFELGIWFFQVPAAMHEIAGGDPASLNARAGPRPHRGPATEEAKPRPRGGRKFEQNKFQSLSHKGRLLAGRASSRAECHCQLDRVSPSRIKRGEPLGSASVVAS